MEPLSGKHIVLGITGSIAAYKSAILCRLLVKMGAEVRVVMTDAAKQFISPLTLSTLSKHKVYVDFFEDAHWENHVELGLWADVFLIAPLTATTLGKMCMGISDNFLLACYLSSRCPVIVAPAMDVDMYMHPATQRNLQLLTQRKVEVIDAEYGELASGIIGKGRMADPETIMEHINRLLDIEKELSSVSIVITAGPTREAIDPVRFLSNQSTGTMGIKIAEEAHRRGASVTLVLGTTTQPTINKAIQVINVESTQEMFKATHRVSQNADLIIFAAAVTDYKPSSYAMEKIKKSSDRFDLSLVRTIDIAENLGKTKKKGQIFIGFALETNNGLENARQKLTKKNFDAIVLNSANEKGAGFGTKTNRITIINKNDLVIEYKKKPKDLVAKDIIDYYIKYHL